MGEPKKTPVLLDTTAVSDDGVSEQNHQEYNWNRPKRMEWIDARKDYNAQKKDRIEISMFCFDQIEIVCDHVNFLTFHPCEFFNVCNLIRG